MNVVEYIPDSLKSQMAQAQLPDNIGFGELMLPVMVKISYRAGGWQNVELHPFAPIAMAPDCKGLQYGQVIFEGLKAYYNAQTGGAGVFCLKQHWSRLNQSATRLAMPTLPLAVFDLALATLLAPVANYIPKNPGDALYIRPFMYASQTGLGLNSDEFEFYVIASPSQAYFAGALKVLVERQLKRACFGGSGMAKMAGNYGSTFLASNKAKEHGCGLSLWLDAQQGRYIEEFSAMNFFAVRNGQLHTPQLTGTILAGVTRAAVIALAGQMAIEVVETDIIIDDLLIEIEQGICTEVFATGTGATITGVSHLIEQSGEVVEVPAGQLMAELKQLLQNIHHGKTQPPQGDWLSPIVFTDHEP